MYELEFRVWGPGFSFCRGWGRMAKGLSVETLKTHKFFGIAMGLAVLLGTMHLNPYFFNMGLRFREAHMEAGAANSFIKA